MAGIHVTAPDLGHSSLPLHNCEEIEARHVTYEDGCITVIVRQTLLLPDSRPPWTIVNKVHNGLLAVMRQFSARDAATATWKSAAFSLGISVARRPLLVKPVTTHVVSHFFQTPLTLYGNDTAAAENIKRRVARQLSILRIRATRHMKSVPESLLATPSSYPFGTAVAERLARSPPIKANRVQSPAGSPDFHKWASCRMMPLVGGFSRGSPISPVPLFRHRSIKTSIIFIGSQDLAVKSLPNLSPSLISFCRSSESGNAICRHLSVL
ncbi:hypothetical protein PR048_031891 [Dryococelus australis]|uniref:Uncharacterized protein n=1 Tax=Dryococelus australis TaxID=614101 RepID=A0ABQ9G7I6_9NEOP|nr:hypothetical protein PR048_031891 [Dryococelus australis]